MAGFKAFSRSYLSVARLWRPVRAAWVWLAPFGAKKLPARSYAALALLTLALLLPGEFSIPAMDRDEARFARRQLLYFGLVFFLCGSKQALCLFHLAGVGVQIAGALIELLPF